jgi:tetratricopeptide (TPR) repeat protein
MWYLIIPPFIIVLSLGALLWFLSRRMSDSDIAEKLSSLKESTQAESQSRALSRKAFFLKLLETLASKFKIATLRIHNFFQHSLERLRRQRTEIDTMRKNIDGEAERHSEEESGPRKSSEESRPVTFFENHSFSKPIIQERPGFNAPVPTRGTAEYVPGGPMLRDEVVHPEPVSNRRSEGPYAGSPVTQSGPREEALIARIVENPRDAAAYEELGDCYFSALNLQDAKECYRQAIKLHPTNRAVKIKIRRLEKVFEERTR